VVVAVTVAVAVVMMCMFNQDKLYVWRSCLLPAPKDIGCWRSGELLEDSFTPLDRRGSTKCGTYMLLNNFTVPFL